MWHGKRHKGQIIQKRSTLTTIKCFKVKYSLDIKRNKYFTTRNTLQITNAIEALTELIIISTSLHTNSPAEV